MRLHPSWFTDQTFAYLRGVLSFPAAERTKVAVIEELVAAHVIGMFLYALGRKAAA